MPLRLPICGFSLEGGAMATDVKKRGTGRPDNRTHRKASTHEKQERKERVLTQGTPSVVTSIADAVVIKHDDLFLLTTPDGRVPLDGNHVLP